jgi:hypothetical protein
MIRPLWASELIASEEFETLEAREVLLADNELRSLNIGVTVRHHVAVLWGPVPSRELSLRAEIRLRTMLPLANVTNELFVIEERVLMHEGTALPSPIPLYLPDMLPVAPAPPAVPEEPMLTPPSP